VTVRIGVVRRANAVELSLSAKTRDRAGGNERLDDLARMARRSTTAAASGARSSSGAAAELRAEFVPSPESARRALQRRLSRKLELALVLM